MSEERIDFVLVDGRRFMQYHDQDCCESVGVEDIAGDLSDLVGLVTLAEEVTNADSDLPPWAAPGKSAPYADSETWTFYRIGTAKGTVVIRWYGTSNGYYSESVSFRETQS